MSGPKWSTDVCRYLLCGQTREAMQLLASVPETELAGVALEVVKADLSSGVLCCLAVCPADIEKYAENVHKVLDACANKAPARTIIEAVVDLLAVGGRSWVKRGRYAELVLHRAEEETLPQKQQLLQEALCLGSKLEESDANLLVKTMAPTLQPMVTKGITKRLPDAVARAVAVFLWVESVVDMDIDTSLAWDPASKARAHLLTSSQEATQPDKLAPPRDKRQDMADFASVTYAKALDKLATALGKRAFESGGEGSSRPARVACPEPPALCEVVKATTFTCKLKTIAQLKGVLKEPVGNLPRGLEVVVTVFGHAQDFTATVDVWNEMQKTEPEYRNHATIKVRQPLERKGSVWSHFHNKEGGEPTWAGCNGSGGTMMVFVAKLEKDAVVEADDGLLVNTDKFCEVYLRTFAVAKLLRIYYAVAKCTFVLRNGCLLATAVLAVVQRTGAQVPNTTCYEHTLHKPTDNHTKILRTFIMQKPSRAADVIEAVVTAIGFQNRPHVAPTSLLHTSNGKLAKLRTGCLKTMTELITWINPDASTIPPPVAAGAGGFEELAREHHPSIFYHGTSFDNAVDIQNEGFKLVDRGQVQLLGRGAYVSGSLDKARMYGRGEAILLFEVDLGRCAVVEGNTQAWRDEYDSCYCRRLQGLDEYCIKDPKRLKFKMCIAGNTQLMHLKGFAIQNDRLIRVKESGKGKELA